LLDLFFEGFVLRFSDVGQKTDDIFRESSLQAFIVLFSTSRVRGLIASVGVASEPAAAVSVFAGSSCFTALLFCSISLVLCCVRRCYCSQPFGIRRSELPPARIVLILWFYSQ
jgi:hypothetical protein